MRYRVSFEVECTPQDDLAHFQPDTVNAQMVGTPCIAVGGGNMAAVRMLVQFAFQGIFHHNQDCIRDMVKAVKIETGREDTDALLAEIERLRTRNARLEAAIKQLDAFWTMLREVGEEEEDGSDERADTSLGTTAADGFRSGQ